MFSFIKSFHWFQLGYLLRVVFMSLVAVVFMGSMGTLIGLTMEHHNILPYGGYVFGCVSVCAGVVIGLVLFDDYCEIFHREGR